MVPGTGRWGADVVVHSLTKFVSGASDIIAGVVCGTDAFIKSLMDFNTGQVGDGGVAAVGHGCVGDDD